MKMDPLRNKKNRAGGKGFGPLCRLVVSMKIDTRYWIKIKSDTGYWILDKK
jgi:hypothetical protein